MSFAFLCEVEGEWKEEEEKEGKEEEEGEEKGEKGRRRERRRRQMGERHSGGQLRGAYLGDLSWQTTPRCALAPGAMAEECVGTWSWEERIDWRAGDKHQSLTSAGTHRDLHTAPPIGRCRPLDPGTGPPSREGKTASASRFLKSTSAGHVPGWRENEVPGH